MNFETSAAPVDSTVDSTMVSALRERLTRRSDSEHVQALIRIVIVSIIWLYIFLMGVDEKLSAYQHQALFFISYCLLAAIGIFALIITWPQASPSRRFLAIIIDFSAASYLMFVMEDKALPFFAVYLWVTIGNGLRYGARYLYMAMAISIVSFVIVISNSTYWVGQWGFSIGLLISLFALPLYFSSLLKQLNDQNNELKKLYEQMAKHAIHDSLTKLPNRKHFNDRLAETIASAERDKKTFAVLYLDLDGFKTINDALGHAVGDQLIEITARRLERCIRKGDMVARVGGDEFVVLLWDITSYDVSEVAEKITQTLSEPFAIGANTLSITSSVGVAIYPQDGTNADVLIHNADSAMYETKRSGKNGFRICSSKPVQQAV